MRLFVFARHAHSTLNVENRVNGDPSVPVELTERGRGEARQLGAQLEALPLDVCVCTRFARTRKTAEIALARRDVPILEEPLLDDVKIGRLEGTTIEDYRRWKAQHTRSDPFPGGESLDDTARRYADAFERLLARPEPTMLVVCHEIPIRYALNGVSGSNDLDGPEHAIPNATPYLFGENELHTAAERIRALAS